jgi:hypothetical protein
LSTKVTSVLRYLCMALLALAVLVPASKADSVNYTFSSTLGTFEYTSNSGFIASGETLILSKNDLGSCTGSCSSYSLLPSATILSASYLGDIVAFGSLTNGAIYVFQTGAFEAYGTYQSLIGIPSSVGTLSVQAPEPGTIGLLACGLLLMAGFASRKRLGAIVSARA